MRTRAVVATLPAVALLVAFSARAEGDNAPPPPAPATPTPAPAVAAPEYVPAPEVKSDALRVNTPLDGRLLTALLELYSLGDAPARARGAEHLGQTGDPRAVAPLVHASSDPSPLVRAAALSALAAFPTAAAVKAAEAAARLEPEELNVRLAAIDALGRQGTPAAGEALFAVADDDDTPGPVRQAAGDAVRTRFPLLFNARGVGVDHTGRTLAVLGGAAFGSYTLAAVGNLGSNGAGPAIGAFGGLLVGGGAAYLVTQRVSLSRGQAMSIISAGAWGLATGLVAGSLTDTNPSSTVVTSLGLLGELGTLIPAIVLRSSLPWTAGDALVADAGGLAAASIAAGFLEFVTPRADSRPGTATIMGFGLAGLAATTAFTQQLHFSPGGGVLIPELALLGGLFGRQLAAASHPAPSFCPPQFGPGGPAGSTCPFPDPAQAVQATRDRSLTGGWLLGAGFGAIGAGLLAQSFPELSVRDDVSLGVASVLGLAIGGGATRLATASSTADDAGSAAGLVLGGAISMLAGPRVRLDVNGVTLTAIGAGWGLWHGFAIPGYLNARTANSVSSDGESASARLGVGLGGFVGFALAPLLRVSAADAAAATSLGAWGLWLAGLGGNIADASQSNFLLGMLASGDAGLALGAVLVSPFVKLSPAAIGIAGLYGVTGTTLAALAAALVTPSGAAGHPIATASLLGSVLGLGVGGLGAATWHRSAVASLPQDGTLGSLAGVPLPLVSPLGVKDGAGIALTWLSH